MDKNGCDCPLHCWRCPCHRDDIWRWSSNKSCGCDLWCAFRIGYAIYSLMGRSASQRGLSPWTTLLYAFGFATVFLLGINLGLGRSIPEATGIPKDLLWLGDSLTGWVVLILLEAGPTVAGFGLYNVSLSLLPSSVANLILTLEPVFTAMLAYILLGERMNLPQILGGLMILSGVVFLRIHREDRA